VAFHAIDEVKLVQVGLAAAVALVEKEGIRAVEKDWGRSCPRDPSPKWRITSLCSRIPWCLCNERYTGGVGGGGGAAVGCYVQGYIII
jgi:hypothetical protein